jgi:4-hydroxy-3-polyprenylbenzoate decarboxylase
MAFNSLEEFVNILDRENELIRVTSFVNPELEITEITDRFSKLSDGGKAILFENTGTEFPVLINAFGSLKRIKLALGVNDLDDIGKEMESLFKDLSSPKENLLQKLQLLPQLSKLSSWLPKKIKGKGACQEVIHSNPNINDIPVLKTWPKDGGTFVTLPMVNTVDPHTGIRNIGMYRLQVLDEKSTGMHWHKHKVGARHYKEYKALNKKMPIAVTLGGDPAYTYSSTAPLPDNIDEYMLAGFLRKKKVELVKCITNDIYVPKDVDFVIEGYVNTSEDFIWEGPFGDHTGYYSLADWYPKFHITCITHKKNAIYPATIVGIPPMEDAYIGKATERIFLTPIKMTMLPEVLDMNLPYAGVAHNITIIKIDKSFAGHALKVINALWGAGQMMFNKMMVVVDKDVDVHNYAEVLQAIRKNVDINSDIVFNKGPLDVLDHSASKFAFGSKMGIDATVKYPEEINKQNNSIESREKIENIIDINDKLKNDGLVVISVEKNDFRFKEWVKQQSSKFDTSVKIVVFIDKQIDTKNLFNVTWTASNHIDPMRDHVIDNNILFLDGTKKTKAIDGFERQWPNPVVMDEETIKKIDSKWSELGLGEFIDSPSNYYKPQMSGLDAVAEE